MPLEMVDTQVQSCDARRVLQVQVLEVAVLPQCRRQGLATQLLSALIHSRRDHAEIVLRRDLQRTQS